MTNARHDLTRSFFANLYRHGQLGILTDVDGTLLPFSERPEDVAAPPEVVDLLAQIGRAPGVVLAIVSGRLRSDLDRLFPSPRSAIMFAEHGAWRDTGNGWEPTVSHDATALESLQLALAPLTTEFSRVRIERKSWSIAVHLRPLLAEEKALFLARLTALLDPWFDANPAFERLWGAEALEVRPRGVTKAIAVAWMRERLGPSCRLLLAGDDLTDEDMFAASLEGDAAILVEQGRTTATAAKWKVPGVDAMRALFVDVLRLRRDATVRPEVVPHLIAPDVERAPRSSCRLLIVSNRLPDFATQREGDVRTKNVGGLVSALLPVLGSDDAAGRPRTDSAAQYGDGGIWLGWSGKLKNRPSAEPELTDGTGFQTAALDLSDDEYRHYYVGFANSALWPALHTFPARIRLSHDDFRSYALANDVFARAATDLVTRDATIWVHDYHLMLFARQVRARGHEGRVGHFLHVPFPGPDVFFLLPWADEILDALLDFDLLGFHTRTYAENFLHCVAHRPEVRVEGLRVVRTDGTHARVGVFPLGISPAALEPTESGDDPEIAGLEATLGDTMLVLGVDRLDYTKGIPERIEAFGRLLELYPEWRRKVCLVQVSVPSREEIDEYSEQRARVENQVGRINGLFGEADWVPIRYLYRSYGKGDLEKLYRAADVGYITPLRDGMNLVAKEFVAAQDETDPGVLLLSRFAGAAEELADALLTNPWDIDGVVSDLDRALRMPLAERLRRHRATYDAISAHTSVDWASNFLAALTGDGESSAAGMTAGLWVSPSAKLNAP